VSAPVRHVDVDLSTSPDEWPFEAIHATLDRGTLSDWRRLAAAIRLRPWGPCARAVEQIASWGELGGLDGLFVRLIDAARTSVDDEARIVCGRRIRATRQALGMTLRQLAAELGTSAPRLSSYEQGRVAPTAVVLGRLDHLAAHLRPEGRREG
jgi:DNA-binding XRE family transcriptional regulator